MVFVKPMRQTIVVRNGRGDVSAPASSTGDTGGEVVAIVYAQVTTTRLA